MLVIFSKLSCRFRVRLIKLVDFIILVYKKNLLTLQGKGVMQTFWLTGKDPSKATEQEQSLI